MQNAAILPDHDHDIDIKTNFRIVKRKYSKENQAFRWKVVTVNAGLVQSQSFVPFQRCYEYSLQCTLLVSWHMPIKRYLDGWNKTKFCASKTENLSGNR